MRIAVGLKSAYDLYLTRTIKNATIVRASAGGGRAMIDMFLKDKLEVAAGVRQPLMAYAKDHPDMRVMDGHFMGRSSRQWARPRGVPRAPNICAPLSRTRRPPVLSPKRSTQRPIGGGRAAGK